MQKPEVSLGEGKQRTPWDVAFLAGALERMVVGTLWRSGWRRKDQVDGWTAANGYTGSDEGRTQEGKTEHLKTLDGLWPNWYVVSEYEHRAGDLDARKGGSDILCS